MQTQYVYLVVGLVFFLGMLVSQRFRNTTDDIWKLYGLSIKEFLQPAWAVALILVFYLIIEDGSLANFIRTAFR